MRDNGVITTDDGGLELPDFKAVKREVAKTSLEIANHVLLESERWVLAILVRDENGRRIPAGGTAARFRLSGKGPSREEVRRA